MIRFLLLCFSGIEPNALQSPAERRSLSPIVRQLSWLGVAPVSNFKEPCRQRRSAPCRSPAADADTRGRREWFYRRMAWIAEKTLDVADVFDRDHCANKPVGIGTPLRDYSRKRKASREGRGQGGRKGGGGRRKKILWKNKRRTRERERGGWRWKEENGGGIRKRGEKARCSHGRKRSLTDTEMSFGRSSYILSNFHIKQWCKTFLVATNQFF